MIKTGSKSLLLIWMMLILAGFLSCSKEKSDMAADEFLKEHIEWLADDERGGRLAGSVDEAEAANYIENLYLQFGLDPAGDDETYIQQFILSGPMTQAMSVENHLSRNVMGIVRGNKDPGQFIIVGAHFDGQGSGGIISMDHGGEPAIHNSADDNASGTAGLLWLAKRMAENPPSASVLFSAFSGEELGLLGSRHLAERLEIPRDSILAMINLDMIGRLEDSDLTIFGTGTSPAWEEILGDIVIHDSLSVTTGSSGTGASDHTSFYDIGIPVLHYFSGIHEQYHRESDTPDLIDYDGMVMILGHVEDVIRKVAEFDPAGLEFTETVGGPPVSMPADGVTLGVIPDYSYSGSGFRIESVRPGSVASNSGIEGGDIIIQMGNISVTDIYDYMEALGTFSRGQTLPVQIRRNDEIIELSITF